MPEVLPPAFVLLSRLTRVFAYSSMPVVFIGALQRNFNVIAVGAAILGLSFLVHLMNREVVRRHDAAVRRHITGR